MHTGPRSLRLTFAPDAAPPAADETLLHVDHGAQTRPTDAGLELAFPPLGGGPFAEVWSSDRIGDRGASGGFRWVRFGGRLFAWAVFDEDGDLAAASRQACAELLALARAGLPAAGAGLEPPAGSRPGRPLSGVLRRAAAGDDGGAYTGLQVCVKPRGASSSRRLYLRRGDMVGVVPDGRLVVVYGPVELPSGLSAAVSGT